MHNEFALIVTKNKNLTKKLRVALEEKYEVEQKMVKLPDEIDTLEMENDSRKHDFSKLEKKSG